MADANVVTAFFSAAYHGDLAAVKSMVKDGQVSANTADSSQGSTVLQWACYGGTLPVVEWLVRDAGAKVGHKNKDGRDALFFSCEHCHKAVAAFLVDKGADVNAKDAPSGHGPLHRACIAGQTRDQAGAEDVITWLLTSTGADPETTDRKGRKPGEADLSVEAPSLKPSNRASAIRQMLEDARRGKPANGIPAASSPTKSPRAAKSPTAVAPVTEAAPVKAPAPSLVATRAAALAASNVTKPVFDAPPPAPVEVPTPSDGASRVAARAAAIAASTGAATKTVHANSSSAVRDTSSNSPIASCTPSGAAASSDQPETGENVPILANAASADSPAAVAGSAADNSHISSVASSSDSTPTKTTPTSIGDSASRVPASDTPPGVAVSTTLARYQRSASGLASGSATPRSPASPPAKGAAQAVIAASKTPKASVLAAAFENKARGQQASPLRRGDSGLSASALAKRAPALSSPKSGGGGHEKNGTTRNHGDSDATKATASFETPGESSTTSGVLNKKQVYVAAAPNTKVTKGNGSPKNSRCASKGKKKESSFMDKFVQMFSVSPQSSPSRSPSRSPRSRSPRLNGGTHDNDKHPRLGFSNSSLFSKEKE